MYNTKNETIMNNDFNIEQLSRKMPYTVPDNFFEQSRQRILDATVNAGTGKKKRIRRMTVIITSVAAMAAAVLLAVFAIQREMPQEATAITAAAVDAHVDDMIENMSDEELNVWAESTDPDMYLASY